MCMPWSTYRGQKTRFRNQFSSVGTRLMWEGLLTTELSHQPAKCLLQGKTTGIDGVLEPSSFIIILFLFQIKQNPLFTVQCHFFHETFCSSPSLYLTLSKVFFLTTIECYPTLFLSISLFFLI